MTVFDADREEQLRQLFDQHLEEGLHHGAQLAVYKDGDLVVSHAGGVTGPDGAATRMDTLHVLFSCTKPYAGVCLHQLVEDGDVDYDDNVTDHWPGFAEEGSRKAEVTVRHVLSHQAGFPVSSFDAEPERWGDWSAAVEAMEEVELLWEPGSTAAYHAVTYGWVVGELVRRVSGEPIDRYARRNVFEPLGMTDTHIGLPDGMDAEMVAELTGFEEPDRCREPDTGLSTLTNKQAAEVFNQEAVQRSVVPAATGVGTARDMARFYACVAAGGELDGTRILEEETVREATSVEVEVERDATLGVPRRYGLGFECGGTVWDKYGVVTPPGVFGHGGLGSIVGWGDPETDIAVSLVTNGIRTEFEHGLRTATVSEAVRSVYG